MAQSRIEELEEQVERLKKELELRDESIKNQVNEIDRLERELSDAQDEISDLEQEDEECDCECEHEEGKVYTISFECIFVASEEPSGSLSIPMQDFFVTLSEKSKQYAGLNQFIEAIEKI